MVRLAKGFTSKAKRKQLRRLKDIAAYNVAKYPDSKGDVMIHESPQSIHGYKIVDH